MDRESSAASSRSAAAVSSGGKSLASKTQAKSLDETASGQRSALSEGAAAGLTGSDSALGPKTTSEERLAEEASSEAGGSTGGGKDSSASGDVKGGAKPKLGKGDLSKAKSGSTSQLSQAGKCLSMSNVTLGHVHAQPSDRLRTMRTQKERNRERKKERERDI